MKYPSLKEVSLVTLRILRNQQPAAGDWRYDPDNVQTADIRLVREDDRKMTGHLPVFSLNVRCFSINCLSVKASIWF